MEVDIPAKTREACKVLIDLRLKLLDEIIGAREKARRMAAEAGKPEWEEDYYRDIVFDVSRRLASLIHADKTICG